MAEGHTATERQLYGPADRKLKLKSGYVIRRNDIPSYFTDELLGFVETFNRWRILGFPRADWGDCPNRMVQTVLTLKPLFGFYAGGH